VFKQFLLERFEVSYLVLLNGFVFKKITRLSKPKYPSSILNDGEFSTNFNGLLNLIMEPMLHDWLLEKGIIEQFIESTEYSLK